MAVEEGNWNSVTRRKQKIQREVFCLTVLSVSKIRPCNVGGRSKQNTQCMYKRNIEARSRNHCCSGKTISITYSECVCSLSYPACKAHALYYIVMWPVWLYHIFPHYLINGTIFGENLLNIKCVF